MMMRDFFLGFIKIHILYHASQGPVYGLWLIEELARHGYSVSPGSLYPTLHAMERRGLLQREERVEEGRRRKYYTATEQGRTALAEIRPKIAELVREVLHEEATESSGS